MEFKQTIENLSKLIEVCNGCIYRCEKKKLFSTILIIIINNINNFKVNFEKSKFKNFLAVVQNKIIESREIGFNPLLSQIAINQIKGINICQFKLYNHVDNVTFHPYCNKLFFKKKNKNFVVCTQHHKFIQTVHDCLSSVINCQDLIPHVLEYIFAMEILQEHIEDKNFLNKFPPLIIVPSFQLLMNSVI